MPGYYLAKTLARAARPANNTHKKQAQSEVEQSREGSACFGILAEHGRMRVFPQVVGMSSARLAGINEGGGKCHAGCHGRNGQAGSRLVTAKFAESQTQVMCREYWHDMRRFCVRCRGNKLQHWLTLQSSGCRVKLTRSSRRRSRGFSCQSAEYTAVWAQRLRQAQHYQLSLDADWFRRLCVLAGVLLGRF